MYPQRPPHYIISLFIFIGLVWQANVWGNQTTIKRHLTAGVDLFRWQEFDANQTRLLSEQGGRLTLQIGWDNLLPGYRFGQVNVKSRIYTGNINYDGQTQSLDPALNGIYVASNSRYIGLSAELEDLYSLRGHSNTALLLGIGIDLWRRDIQNSIDARNNLVAGFIEDYQLIFTRMGIQWHQQGLFGNSQTRIGIKYPLRINEQVSGISPTLQPGRNGSLFASYRLNLTGRRNTIMEIYYDSLRLSASPVVIDQSGNSWLQPQSHQDNIGILFGMPF